MLLFAGFLLGLEFNTEDVSPRRRTVSEIHGVTRQKAVFYRHMLLFMILHKIREDKIF
jgi:hypothetical protein